MFSLYSLSLLLIAGKFMRSFEPMVTPYRRAIFLCSGVALICALDDFLTVRQRRRVGYTSGADGTYSGVGVMDPSSAAGNGSGGGSDSHTSDCGNRLRSFGSKVAARFTIREGTFVSGGEFGMLALTFFVLLLHAVVFFITLLLAQPEVIITQYNGKS
jgi:hypothetical protein